MVTNQSRRISKFLSYVLRHHPEEVGIKLDEQGWVSLNLLVEACNGVGETMTRAQVLEVVKTNEKQRFAVSEDGRNIRANQGHSIDVELGYEETPPPEELFHGTAKHFMEPIQAEGLKKMSRHHVHLSADRDTAIKVGQRHGKPLVLIVQAGAMHRAGHKFYRSTNGVWLADHVPANFLAPFIESP